MHYIVYIQRTFVVYLFRLEYRGTVSKKRYLMYLSGLARRVAWADAFNMCAQVPGAFLSWVRADIKVQDSPVAFIHPG